MTGAITTSAAPKPTFPLMAWDYADSKATLKAMAECGINMVAFVPPDMLDECQRNGIKAIVYDPRLSDFDWNKPFDIEKARPAFEAAIKAVNNHPAVFGYHIKDEPSGTEYQSLAKAAQLIKELAPGKWPYINLLPGGGEAYDKYIEDFCTICQPPILSYDLYAVPESGGFADGFWVTLARFRSAGLKHNLPFYNIVLTAPHWHYRELTMTDLRIQTFGSLVYGCKGLSYYKFSSRHLYQLGAPCLGNFRMGPLDEFGEKTQVWEWLRNINRQILNMGPTLLKLHSDDVYHIGGTIPNKNHGPDEKSMVKSLPSDGQWVVGDFTHEDGSRWVMIVNKDMKLSHPCQAEFNVPVKKLQYLDAVDGKLGDLWAPQWFFLAPGQGVLLKLQL